MPPLVSVPALKVPRAYPVQGKDVPHFKLQASPSQQVAPYIGNLPVQYI
jgi:hypothetical protein